MGADWALNNQTYLYMNGWFHYAKIYAALAGCIGFMMIKYGWGIGKQHWFKPFPFVIVAINILIAVGSDFESGIRGAMALAATGTDGSRQKPPAFVSVRSAPQFRGHKLQIISLWSPIL